MIVLYGYHGRSLFLIFQFIERFYQLMDNDSGGRLTIQELLDAFGKLTWLVRHLLCQDEFCGAP